MGAASRWSPKRCANSRTNRRGRRMKSPAPRGRSGSRWRTSPPPWRRARRRSGGSSRSRKARRTASPISARAADEVTRTTGSIREQMEDVTATMAAGQAKVRGIESVAEGAAHGLAEIATAVELVEQATAAAEQQGASTEEMAAAASSLLEAAERLRGLVRGFRV